MISSHLARHWVDCSLSAVTTFGRTCTRTATGESTELSNIRELSRWLYLDVHLAGTHDAHVSEMDAAITSLAPWFGRTFKSRWRVVGAQAGGQAVVTDGRIQIVTDEDSIAIEDDGLHAAVLLPRLRERAMPGWAVVVSPSGPAPSTATSRLYLHARSPSESANIVTVLDNAPALGRWSYKTSTSSVAYDRPDAAVLYLPTESVNACAAVLSNIESCLAESTPGYSRRIGRGIALGGSQLETGSGSFGVSVAHAIATHITSARDAVSAVKPYTEQLYSHDC